MSILKHKAVRQINISLHSEKNKESYLEDIHKVVENLKEKIVVLRYWTMDNEKSTDIVDKVLDLYKLSTNSVDKHIKIRNNLFLDKAEEFTWPSLESDYYNDCGKCYALKDQLAILVDGTVVPCCLDSNGVINLGNIYNEELIDIINSKRYQTMKKSFQNRKCSEELCKRCSFKERLLTNK